MTKKQSAGSALDGILNSVKREQEPPPSPAPAIEPRLETKPKVGKRERSGKSIDPEFGQFTVYLRNETRKQARRILEDKSPKRDFSELVQELLERWIKAQS